MKLTERQRSVLIALGFAVAAAVIIILAVKKSGSSGAARERLERFAEDRAGRPPRYRGCSGARQQPRYASGRRL